LPAICDSELETVPTDIALTSLISGISVFFIDLESVVDCLTMCRNDLVVTQAQFFLQQMCVGNTTSNLFMISKYVISLLPCDFNPKVQAMACRVLPGLIVRVQFRILCELLSVVITLNVN